MKILIIEDEPIWRLRIRMMLVQYQKDIQTEFAATFLEAKMSLKRETPDLVISDVVLPDGLSYELFPAIRTYPIVFITGYPNDEYLKFAMDLPKTAFIVKPFHELSFQAVVQSLVPQQTAETTQGIMVIGKFRMKFLLNFKHIMYIQADRNYVHLCTANNRYSIKRSLRTVLHELDQRFIQVHKAFVINVDYANRLDLSSNQINVNGNLIPLGRAFRQQAIEYFTQKEFSVLTNEPS